MQNQYFVIKNTIFNYDLSAMDITVFSAIVSMINGKTKSITAKYSAIAKRVDELQEKTLVNKDYYITKNSDFGHNRYNVLCKVQLKKKNPRSNDYKNVFVKAGSKNFKVVSFYTNRLKTDLEFCVLKQIT